MQQDWGKVIFQAVSHINWEVTSICMIFLALILSSTAQIPSSDAQNMNSELVTEYAQICDKTAQNIIKPIGVGASQWAANLG